jgi:hypothetical protein
VQLRRDRNFATIPPPGIGISDPEPKGRLKMVLQPADRTMLYWMASTCRQLRGDTALEVVAARAGASVGALRAFERANSWPQAHRLDRVIAAYADIAGIDGADAREVWRRALALWEVHGEAPVLAEPVAPAEHDAPERPQGESSHPGARPAQLHQAVQQRVG